MTIQTPHSDDEIKIQWTESIELEIELLSEIDYRNDPRPQQREGVEALKRVIADLSLTGSLPDPATIALLLVRLRDLQVRDFALGCMKESELEEHRHLWQQIIAMTPERFLAPPATILAAIAYECGDHVCARESLEKALEVDSSYPLALLLQRVFKAEWPAQTFATMRNELHPKITAAIFDDEDRA